MKMGSVKWDEVNANETRIILDSPDNERVILHVHCRFEFASWMFCYPCNRTEILLCDNEQRIMFKKKADNNKIVSLQIEVRDPLFGLYFSSVYEYTEKDNEQVRTFLEEDKEE